MTKVINLRKRQGVNYKPIKTTKSYNKKINVSEFEIIKIILTIVSLVSVCFGCFIYKNNELDSIKDFCLNYISQLQEKNYFQVFLFLIKVDLIYLLATFFFGTSLIGLPLTFIPLSIKSLFIGCLSSFMYCEYNLKGVLYSLIFFYPLFTITTTSLIYSANESIYMSKYMFKTITNKNTVDDISIRLYLLRYAVLLIVNVICIAINSLLIVMLSGKFNLNPVA